MRLRSSTKFKGPVTRSHSRGSTTNVIEVKRLNNETPRSSGRRKTPSRPSSKELTTDDATYKMSIFPTMQNGCACFLTPAMTTSLPSLAYSGASPLSHLARPFRIGGVPGKGRGMIATKNIPVATLILAESPLIVVPGEMDLKRMGIDSAARMETMLQRLVTVLPKRRQDLYVRLYNAKATKGILNGIFETNCFMLSNLGDNSAYDSYNGVFNNMSKPNHSCSPNAHYRWDDATFTMQLRAVREINENEEILISYTSILHSSSVRVRDLKEDYGFLCACRACCNAATSDANRRFFRKLEFRNTRLENISSHYLESRLEILSLMENEGVEASDCYPKLLKEILMGYTNRGERQMVLQFRKKYLFAATALGVPVDPWILEL